MHSKARRGASMRALGAPCYQETDPSASANAHTITSPNMYNRHRPPPTFALVLNLAGENEEKTDGKVLTKS